MNHHTPILASLLASAAVSTASAAVAVSNLGESPNGGIGFQTQVATSFTTGDGLPSWSLESIAIAFTRDTGNSADGITVSIHSDAGGTPGTQTVSLTGSAITDPGTYLFTPSSATNLAASTTYWLVMSGGSLSGDITRWALTSSDSESPALAGWSIGDDVFTSSSGWASAGPQTGQFAVNVVPEPSGALLAGLGVFSIALRRRRGGF
ncbi:PEP-CTERM sorting domain-containing protein [Luteolibacter marinus]|uniref:PEP-CTERM sorting domain-containing protein n=1 Tax=Luteolibacter marinus TaxID=2776705 RepID=UPI001868F801|nr:PEP-CTERM sorting domain-containing protein [Luteolibacter marinus]